jgi:hypothetical protein
MFFSGEGTQGRIQILLLAPWALQEVSRVVLSGNLLSAQTPFPLDPFRPLVFF